MFKFLDAAGCTYYDGELFAYNLPQRGQKWSEWTEHPDPAEPDGKACGPGRLYLMRKLNAHYAPQNWWIWWAEGRNLIGEDEEKTAYDAVRLRRISPQVLWRLLRPPFNWGYEANLRRASLIGANLYKANLRRVNLSGASLSGANLSGANLREANLSWTDLSWANLSGASLYGANLSEADLHRANLNRVDLRGAGLCGANMSEVNL